MLLSAVLAIVSVLQHHHTTPVTGLVSNSFADYLVLLYKGTYVAYGNGRASERDLPECGATTASTAGGGGLEACNLSHQRYWLPPLVERLCRCPGHTSCPLHHYHASNASTSAGSSSTSRNQNTLLQTGESGNGENGQQQQQPREEPLVQHINNRAHLQFCNIGVESSALPTCANETDGGVVGLTVELVERYQEQHQQQGTGGDRSRAAVMVVVTDSHTTLHCRCDVPRYWTHINSTRHTTTAAGFNGNDVGSSRSGSPNTNPRGRQQARRPLLVHTHKYACHQLPRCTSYQACSEVRRDTFESYYSCSCPPDHLCLLPRRTGFTTSTTAPHTVPHYTGTLMQGVCTPHYSTTKSTRRRHYG